MIRLRRRRPPRPAAAGVHAGWAPAAVRHLGTTLAAVPLAAIPLVGQPSVIGWHPAQAARAAPPAHGSFRRIILPDLAVISPAGLPAAGLAALAKIRGVRSVLAVDGASVTIRGQRVNLIAVNPAWLRSWTPPGTASDQRLWSALASGGFAASPAARARLGLRRGRAYRLMGVAPVSLTFGGSAAFGVAGIDLVAGPQVSARLGLIRNVATFISAPGVSMTALQRAVRTVVGRHATQVGLRRQQLPVDASPAGRPTTYLALFRVAAARYCPGLSWTVLAAIGQIESGDGANLGPSSAGALGPMQFLPSTWKLWGITAFGEPGPPDIMDPYDAVPAAARYLCAAGAATPAGLSRAIYAYNHATWYVQEVLALAREYAQAYG